MYRVECIRTVFVDCVFIYYKVCEVLPLLFKSSVYGLFCNSSDVCCQTVIFGVFSGVLCHIVSTVSKVSLDNILSLSFSTFSLNLIVN